MTTSGKLILTTSGNLIHTGHAPYEIEPTLKMVKALLNAGPKDEYFIADVLEHSLDETRQSLMQVASKDVEYGPKWIEAASKWRWVLHGPAWDFNKLDIIWDADMPIQNWSETVFIDRNGFKWIKIFGEFMSFAEYERLYGMSVIARIKAGLLEVTDATEYVIRALEAKVCSATVTCLLNKETVTQITAYGVEGEPVNSWKLPVGYDYLDSTLPIPIVLPYKD